MFIEISKKFVWTGHSQVKMKQYGISKQKVLSILRNPERKEKAIVPGLVAAMKTNKIYFREKQTTLKKAWQAPSNIYRKAPGEIWVMFKDVKTKFGATRKVISTWRYPGVSKPGEDIPIPEDIKNDLINGRWND